MKLAKLLIMKFKKLKDICVYFGDGDWIEKKDQSKAGIRLIQTGNVKDGYFSDRVDKGRYITNKTFKELNCNEIFEGDILISRLPEPVGRACIIPKLDQRMITAVDCTIVRANNEVDKNYLIYYLQSQKYYFDVNQKITGATRLRISKENLGNILIPLPEINEQKKIIDKLDFAFEKLKKIDEDIIEKKRLIINLKRSIINSVTIKDE